MVEMVACEGAVESTARPAKERRHRAADGTVFVYDAATKAWRTEVVQEESGTPDVQLALPWRLFDVDFSKGQFLIAGIPVLLGTPVEARAPVQQEHADTGRSVWDGALCLAKLLERQPLLVQGRSVLEVGAGRGVVGLSAALLGAKEVAMTDQAYCIPALDKSIEASRNAWNGTGARMEVLELDWMRPEDFVHKRTESGLRIDFDIVLGADVVWLEELAAPLAHSLGEVCRAGGGRSEVLIVHQTRTERTDEAFLNAMQAEGFVLRHILRGKGSSIQTPPTEESVDMDAAVGLEWHDHFVPDSRFKAWSFRLADSACESA